MLVALQTKFAFRVTHSKQNLKRVYAQYEKTNDDFKFLLAQSGIS